MRLVARPVGGLLVGVDVCGRWRDLVPVAPLAPAENVHEATAFAQHLRRLRFGAGSSGSAMTGHSEEKSSLRASWAVQASKPSKRH